MKKAARKQKPLIGSMTNSRKQTKINRYFSEEEMKQSEEDYFSGVSPDGCAESQPHAQKKQISGGFFSQHKKLFLLLAGVIICLLIVAAVILHNKNSIVKEIIKSDIAVNIADEMVGESYNKNVLDKDFDRNKVAVNAGVTTPEGFESIAIFGIDARDSTLRTGSRSDSMMVLSVNEETNDVKMGSVFRDTYLVDDCSENYEYYIGKANAAYAVGGPEAALSMLNRNWDLAVTDYVVVNFGGLSNIIDAMGGIELEVTKKEVKEINYHMKGQIDSFGGKYVKLKGHGKLKLNGAQATTFCRIRSVDFKNPLDGQTYTIDYGRTARQRYVLNELFRQAKEGGVSTLIKMINEVCENNVGDNKFIMTSLPLEDLVRLLGSFMDMEIAGQDAFPHTDKAYITSLDSGSTIVAHTLEENVKLFHAFLYGQNSYQPSSDFYMYDSWITRWVNVQKTGSADLMFDPNSATQETLAYIENDDDDFNYENVTYQSGYDDPASDTGYYEETTYVQPEDSNADVTTEPESVYEDPTEPVTEATAEPATEPVTDPPSESGADADPEPDGNADADE